MTDEELTALACKIAPLLKGQYPEFRSTDLKHCCNLTALRSVLEEHDDIRTELGELRRKLRRTKERTAGLIEKVNALTSAIRLAKHATDLYKAPEERDHFARLFRQHIEGH